MKIHNLIDKYIIKKSFVYMRVYVLSYFSFRQFISHNSFLILNVMFSQPEEHNYFWLSHAELVQVTSMVVVVVVLVGSITTSPTITPPHHVMPSNFSVMQEDFNKSIQNLYLPKNTSYLATPPLLRQILYSNLIPCEPNFLKSHNITDCDVEAKQNVKLYLTNLDEAPDPFEIWPEDVCGFKPFAAVKNRYTTGQGFFPSLKGEMCYHPTSGYVLLLPFPPLLLDTSFFPQCVVAPMQIWFQGHVREDTFAIISDAILISNDTKTVERHQLSYERLSPLNLWWPMNRVETHYRYLWVKQLSAFLCFLVFVYQIIALLMEKRGGWQQQTYFSSLARKGLHCILIILSFSLFIIFASCDLRWNNLIEALTIGPPSPAVAAVDEKQHLHVMQIYQTLTNHADLEAYVIWGLVILLFLHVTDLFTCTTGYIYGVCNAIQCLVPTLLVAACWLVLLGLLAHVFHDEENLAFRSMKVSFQTLFVTRFMDIEYEKEAFVHLLILLHMTMFLLVPLFAGLLMTNLNVSKALKRGKKRWWAVRQE